MSFLSPGVLPEPGIDPKFPVTPAFAGAFFITEPPGKLEVSFFLIFVFILFIYIYLSVPGLSCGMWNL